MFGFVKSTASKGIDAGIKNIFHSRVTVTTAVLLAALLLSVRCFASEAVTVRTEQKSARCGETVTLAVSLEGNSGLLAARLLLTYDKSRLMLTAARDGGLLKGAVFSQSTSEYPFIMLWNSASAENSIGDGTVAELEFTVLRDAPEGTAFVNLSYLRDDIYDAELNEVALDIINGGITVTAEKNTFDGSLQPTLNLTQNKTKPPVTGGKEEAAVQSGDVAEVKTLMLDEQSAACRAFYTLFVLGFFYHII